MKLSKAMLLFHSKNLFYHEGYGIGIGMEFDLDTNSLELVFLDEGDSVFRREFVPIAQLRKAKKKDLLDAKEKLLADPHLEYLLLFGIALSKEKKESL